MEQEIDKEKYFSLFEKFKNNSSQSPPPVQLDSNSNILIVDFLNTFMRSFLGSPAMNDNGEHIGGITSFLQSIGQAIRLTRATRCIIVADGEGGSSRRRKIYPDYKMKRRVQAIQANRTYEFKSEEEELIAMKTQMVRLIQYLSKMPVIFTLVDNMEADDIIAYIATEVYNKPENKITIMSSDKDFLQLVNERISVWSPTKKKMYTPSLVYDEYGIDSKNFIFYRILDGDKSDNIQGIQGTGLKTIKKFLPFLCESQQTSINEIVDYCEAQNANKKTKKKFYSHILENKNTLFLNEKLMQLESPQMSAQSKMKVTEKVTGEIPVLNKYEIHLMYMHDKISTAMPNIDEWLIKTFSILNSFALAQNRMFYPTNSTE